MNLCHWTRSARTPEEAWSRNLTILLTAIFTGLVPLSYAIIASSAPQSRMAESIARLQIVTIVAASVGPLIGGILVDRIGVRPGYFYSLLYLATLLFTGALLRRRPRQNAD